ncbi:MAG: copper-binding protein, partial [Acidobacteriota bacterium]
MGTRKTPFKKTVRGRVSAAFVASPIALAAFALLTTACQEEPPAAAPDVYQVRGIVKRLPEAGRGPQELSVRHEAIPEFRNMDGEVVGMDVMTMPFPIADVEMLAGLETGDRIEMQFQVQWEADHPLAITAIETLPPDTILAFEAQPPESAEGTAGDGTAGDGTAGDGTAGDEEGAAAPEAAPSETAEHSAAADSDAHHHAHG